MNKSTKFKDLDQKDLEYLTFVYYEDMSHREKMDILTSKYGVNERSIRRWWAEKLNLSPTFSKLPQQLQKAQERQIDSDVEVLLVTSAQNKTSINKEFLSNLQTYANYIQDVLGKKTAIIVSPSRYRNPTSPLEQSNKSEEWWVDEVQEYLYYGKLQFGDVIVSSDSRVRPTAKDPLLGYEVLAKDNHLIIPHSKVHFRTVPRLQNAPLRVMATTGFISNKNYSDSRAGDTAYEHHSYGFIVVEKKTKDRCYIPRNVKVKSDGSFIDVLYSVENGQVQTITESAGFVYGDIHTRVVDKDVLEKTLQLVRSLNPQKQVLHDILDASTINPHERKDMYIQRQKIVKGEHLLEEEIEESLQMIDYIHKNSEVPETYITLSNHDVFIDRHINDENWKKDLHNSPAYLKYAYIQQTVDLTEYGGIYGYLVQERFGVDSGVTYLDYANSLNIGTYECGLHGDITINGARSNNRSFARLNMKMVIGHQHSPSIFNNITVVGVTAKLNQYYNRKSLSSWCHAHCVIHNNNKNQLLVYDDDLELSGLF